MGTPNLIGIADWNVTTGCALDDTASPTQLWRSGDTVTVAAAWAGRAAVAVRAGHDAIFLYTHERMTENLALCSRIGYAEYTRKQYGPARLVLLRKQLN